MTDETASRHAPRTTVSMLTLSSFVVGSMVGAGVFSLPGTFAAHTGVFGSLVAWLVAGAGMFLLALVFQRLEGGGVELQPARGEASGDGVDLGSKELDIEHR